MHRLRCSLKKEIKMKSADVFSERLVCKWLGIWQRGREWSRESRAHTIPLLQIAIQQCDRVDDLSTVQTDGFIVLEVVASYGSQQQQRVSIETRECTLEQWRGRPMWILQIIPDCHWGKSNGERVRCSTKETVDRCLMPPPLRPSCSYTPPRVRMANLIMCTLMQRSAFAPASMLERYEDEEVRLVVSNVVGVEPGDSWSWGIPQVRLRESSLAWKPWNYLPW